MLIRVGALPGEPLAAAAEFHARVLPQIVQARDEPTIAAPLINHLTLVFAPADHTHRGWRLAVVQSLARAQAPRRINAVASDDERAIAAAGRYLSAAEGVTGQYWTLDGNGAGEVLS